MTRRKYNRGKKKNDSEKAERSKDSLKRPGEEKDDSPSSSRLWFLGRLAYVLKRPDTPQKQEDVASSMDKAPKPEPIRRRRWKLKLCQCWPCRAIGHLMQVFIIFIRGLFGAAWRDHLLVLILFGAVLFLSWLAMEGVLQIFRLVSAQDVDCSIVYVTVPGPIITVSLIAATPSNPARGTYYYSVVDGTTQWMNSVAPPSRITNTTTILPPPVQSSSTGLPPAATTSATTTPSPPSLIPPIIVSSVLPTTLLTPSTTSSTRDPFSIPLEASSAFSFSMVTITSTVSGGITTTITRAKTTYSPSLMISESPGLPSSKSGQFTVSLPQPWTTTATTSLFSFSVTHPLVSLPEPLPGYSGSSVLSSGVLSLPASSPPTPSIASSQQPQFPPEPIESSSQASSTAITPALTLIPPAPGLTTSTSSEATSKLSSSTPSFSWSGTWTPVCTGSVSGSGCIVAQDVTTKVISFGNTGFSFVFPKPDITTTVSYWKGTYPIVPTSYPTTLLMATRTVRQTPLSELPSYELFSPTATSFTTIVTTVISGSDTRTETSVAAAEATSCGEYGNFTLNFDDTTIGPAKDDILPVNGMTNPYHHLFYANGYTYVPDEWEPYPAISQPNVAMFLPFGGSLLPNTPFAGTLLPGEIGAGPRASVNAYWFNAYYGFFGCSLNGITPCILRISGYRYDATLEQEVVAAEQNVTIPACWGYIKCRLTQVYFNERSKPLSGIQINAYTYNLGIPQIFMMDNLQLEWYNNSCSAGILRIGHHWGPP